MTTRDKIITEAEEQFIQCGIANTQMKEIAAAVEINRRTLYRYFPTKDELAFIVEMKVMKQISEYFDEINNLIDKSLNGYSKVQKYFNSVNLDRIKRQVRFTAEFDRYFQSEYPSENMEKDFLAAMNPENDRLYSYIEDGQKDGSIRSDLSPLEIYQFLSQSFFSLFQRLILREKHLKYEFCDNIDFSVLYKDIILKGISIK